jgi:phosphoribosylformylglycinamidine cyclo-ligase
VTGGGWSNLERMGEYRYAVEDPFDAQTIFEFVQELGSVSDAEMHTTFNMGTGFVASVAPEDAEPLAGATDDGRVIGQVEDGDGIAIRGLEL